MLAIKKYLGSPLYILVHKDKRKQYIVLHHKLAQAHKAIHDIQD
jgi:hypothetical protein